MHADAYFAASPVHLVGQDYALASAAGERVAWALVADGCSGSPDTDIGARLVARAARASLRLGHLPRPRLIAARASRVARALALPPECLDSTCLYVLSEGDDVVAGALGDGIVARWDRDGRLELRVVEYPAGMPAYPGYAIDEARGAAWRSAGGDAWVVRVRKGDDDWRVEAEGEGTPPPWRFAASDCGLVLVATDGACAFTRGDEGVDVHAIVSAFGTIASPTGRFVARRARRLLGRIAARAGWKPEDDVAFAGVSCPAR
jgi:hypothetical protein